MLQSMGLQRVGHNSVSVNMNSFCVSAHCVFLNLEGQRLWGCVYIGVFI